MKLSIFYAATVSLVVVHCRGQDESAEPQPLSEAQETPRSNSETSIQERKFCKISKKCMSKNGKCIPKDEICDGEIIEKGCKKTRGCNQELVCCAPKISPCRVVTPEPCPTKGPIVNSVLNWHVVDEDYFVAFDIRMSWLEAQDFCINFGLELFHPKNIMNVAKYLNENAKSTHERHGYFHVGGRGNGTHQVWLSGEVVSKNEPWYKSTQQYVRTSECLAIITNDNHINHGSVLRSWRDSCQREDAIYPFLCGTPHEYGLTWHYVGEDKFARYSHKLNWEDSRAVCKTFGLDLYSPKDVFAVSAYLDGLSSYDDNILKENYWLGGKRNGDQVFWLSGEEIPIDSSVWWDNPISTSYQCVLLFADSRYADRPIRTWDCDYYQYYPVCG